MDCTAFVVPVEWPDRAFVSRRKANLVLAILWPSLTDYSMQDDSAPPSFGGGKYVKNYFPSSLLARVLAAQLFLITVRNRWESPSSTIFFHTQ